MNQQLDLLRRGEQSDAAKASVSGRADGWLEKWARWLPFILVAGFVVLTWLLFGDRLVPAREVVLEPVMAVESGEGASVSAGPGGGDPYEAPMLFQASGWIEADPYSIKATALVDGIVSEVLVLEGQSVEAGQLLARLIDEDAALDLKTAEGELASVKAEAQAAQAGVTVAEAKLETHLKTVAAAEAKLAELQDLVNRLETIGAGAVSGQEISQARLQQETQMANIAALRASRPEREAQLNQSQHAAENAAARVAQSETEVARRRLALERMQIRAPVDGIVQRLLVVPGQKRMVGMDDPDSATIAILYQPEKVQARIDIPLEEASKLTVGQPVRVHTHFLADTAFRGTVSRIVGEADLQRNTLQAKVRIINPDRRLRPEMLCRAEFLAVSNGAATTGTSASQGRRVRVFVPTSAIIGRDGKQADVWVLGTSRQRVERRTITLGANERENHIAVSEGLQPGDRVVVNPPADLEAGERVRPEN